MQAENSQNFAFCARLAEARKSAGLSRAELAAKLGLHYPSQISRYESGKSYPSVPGLILISKLLSVDLHWLLTGEVSPAAAKDVEKYKDLVTELRIFTHYYVQHLGHLKWDLLDKKEAVVARMVETGDNTLVAQLQDIERRLSQLRTAHDERMARYAEVMTALGYPGTL